MLIVTIVLIALLIGKSLYLDPVGQLDVSSSQYATYALDIAPIQNKSLLEKWGLLSYRLVHLVQEEEGGTTDIMYRDETSKEWSKSKIRGQYSAKVRAYLMGILPVKDIYIKGGIQEWKED